MSAPVLETRIATDSDSFRANAAHNRALAIDGGDNRNTNIYLAAGDGDADGVASASAPAPTPTSPPAADAPRLGADTLPPAG